MATKAQLQQMLTQVETAITDLVTGQVTAFRVAGQEYTLSNIRDLRTWRQELQAELSHMTGGATTNFATVRRAHGSRGGRPW